jgi:dienelactone hydrolase
MSPVAHVDAISPRVQITLVVGDQDNVTPPGFSAAYESAANQAGKRAHVVVIPGKDHEVFLDAEVLRIVIENLK